MTVEQFNEDWAPFHAIVMDVRKERDKLTEVRTIELRWETAMNLQGRSYHFLANVKNLALRMTFEEIIELINRFIANRFIHSASSRPRTLNTTVTNKIDCFSKSSFAVYDKLSFVAFDSHSPQSLIMTTQ